MVEYDQISTAPPLFSIIIGVYNDWEPLDQCLRSLAQQASAPSFEVIVVDDGSKETAPDFIRQRIHSFPLIVVRQAHAGVSAARNQGARISGGSVLLFVDADCKFQGNCLDALGSTIAGSVQHNCFQLHLVGDCSGIVGRTEQLRLITLQDHLLQPDGCIRYLNTAGFAMRRACADIDRGVFDPVAIRAEDTLLLANLIKGGELPLFVASATVQHAIPLSLMECLRKDIRLAHLDGRTYDIIAAKGVKLRVSSRERLRMLLSMWKTSGQHSIGKSAWFVLIARQAPRLIVLFLRKIIPWVFRGIPRPDQTHPEIHDETNSE
jgi:glycosyltransferase involved in cell wall biosynthesis